MGILELRSIYNVTSPHWQLSQTLGPHTPKNVNHVGFLAVFCKYYYSSNKIILILYYVSCSQGVSRLGQLGVNNVSEGISGIFGYSNRA